MKETLIEWLEKNWGKDNIFPPGMDSDTALEFLKDYLLPKDWCVMYPCAKEQANTEIVTAILNMHSKRYKNELKDKKRRRINGDE